MLLILCLVLITVVSFAQVIIRKIPSVAALTWAEEFCRFMWIFSVFLSLPYTIKHRSMLRVSILADKLPAVGARSLELTVNIINCLVMVALAAVSFGVLRARIASGETSPAMVWPMWILYLVMMAGYALGAVRALVLIIAKKEAE